MSEDHTHNGTKLHWPTIFLGIIVASVFLIAIFSYQLKSTDFAVVSTLGYVKKATQPGLRFRWPFPIQKIYLFDNRQRCFEGNVGKIEETLTADKQNIILGIFVIYKIVDPVKLFQSEKNVEEAEEKLNSLMRSSKDEIVGKYNFSAFINTDKGTMKLSDIEDEIAASLADIVLKNYGLKIISVGIKSLGIPEKVTNQVIIRMKNEREAASAAYREEGNKLAQKIRDEADKNKQNKLAIAKAKAKIIRAEGDAEAATYYAVFKEEPELAVFLKKLDSLKKIVESRTTLILDTDTAPFDLLQPGAEQLKTKTKK